MVNAAYQRIMAGSEVRVGEHHDEIVARRLAEDEYDAEAPAAVMRALEEGDPAFDRIRIRPNGTVLSVRAGRLPDGGHITVMTDITARHRAEREAERRATTLRDMLDNQKDGVALFDSAGILIACNALAARLSGLSPEEMRPGLSLDELRRLQLAVREFGAPDTPTALEYVARSSTTIGNLPRRYVRRRPDGSLLEVRTDPTPDGGFIRTYRDVTEEYEARAELERARDVAEGASRAKSGFLAAVTHELRTPLNAVIGFSEAILEETRPDRMRAHAAEVLSAGRTLLSLVDGILAATRVEAGEDAVGGPAFDPAPVLRAAAADLAGAVEEAGLTLTLDVPRRLPQVRGISGGCGRWWTRCCPTR
ncbi:PAS-domain containing protein [Roseomonas sp. CCTCC AB2023176]|uniref:PAS domain-containing sensor histidine kinase n=1 Tax=Roseomonas sp. CCTCC AB2023176 TaxID=3342640 RepID=UPI0035DE895E